MKPGSAAKKLTAFRAYGTRHEDSNLVRVQDVKLSAADDPAVLEWAVQEGRVLLTEVIS